MEIIDQLVNENPELNDNYDFIQPESAVIVSVKTARNVVAEVEEEEQEESEAENKKEGESDSNDEKNDSQ